MGLFGPSLVLPSFILFLSLMPKTTWCESEGSLLMPKELKEAEIEDKAGVEVPLDIQMTDQDGHSVLLKDYFKDKPVMLFLHYNGCPGLCSLVLNGAANVLKNIKLKPNKDFFMVSASIDHREKPQLAKLKRASYLAYLGEKEDSDIWNFHVMTAHEAKRLAEHLGFHYYYDKKTDQFAHGAGFFVLSPKGILSRTLFGIEFKPTDIMLALSEAAEGKIGSFIDRVLLSCFHYDPDSHRYGVYIMGVMRLGGILTMLIVGILLVILFRGERNRIKPIV